MSDSLNIKERAREVAHTIVREDLGLAAKMTMTPQILNAASDRIADAMLGVARECAEMAQTAGSTIGEGAIGKYAADAIRRTAGLED